MKKFYLSTYRKVRFFLILIALSSLGKISAQCGPCGAITFSVDLSSKVDTAYALVNQTRSGNCCGDNNCVKFVVLLNPGSDLINFNVTNPSPSGSAFYSINCGTLTSIGTPVCVYGATSVCITYCKPGGDSPTYHIIATKTVKASKDITVRVGCSATMSVTGLSVASASWTSVFPGAAGAYNSFLSCTTGCTLTTVTPTAVVMPYIDYQVSGTPNTVCGGISKDTVRVYIVPGMSISITPTNAVVCSGGSPTVALTASVSGGAPPYTYTWSSGGNTNTTGVGAGNYTLFVQDTAASCPAIATTVTVTPITTPSAPTVGSNSPLCAGQTLSLTATNSGGTSWSWTGPNSFTSTTQNPVISNASALAAGVYSVTSSLSGCTGPPGTGSIVVNAIPAAPVPGSNSPICTGQTLSLTANFVSGATYSWSGPNSFTSTAQNPVITNVTAAAAGTYSVFVTVSGCPGPQATVNVTVNATPAAPVAGSNSPLCAGQTLNLTASVIAGATYSWTGPNSFTSNIQNPSITNPTVTASGIYSVAATVTGCTGPFGTISVTINPIPAAPVAASNSPLCAGQTLSLTASVIAGATYSWTGPNSFTSNVQNPTITNPTVTAGGNYSVTATVNGCTGPAGIISVTIYPIPAAPTPGSNSPICSGQTLSLTANNMAGATYSWTGPNTFTSNVQNPTITNPTITASGTYSVRATINGCTGPFGIVSVTIYPIPAAPSAGSNSPLCAGQTLSLTASTMAGGTYSWTGPNSFTSNVQNPTITNPTVTASGIYSVAATVNGCKGPNGTISVTVNAIPAAPLAGSNSPICAGQTLSLTAANMAGATYSWTGPNAFTSGLQNPTITNPTVTASGNYSVAATVNGCTGPFGIVSVTIYPIPAAPSAGSNSPLCAGQTLSLTASNMAGATYSWTGPASYTSNIQNPSITNVSLAAAGVYSVRATVNGCTGPFGTISVTINPIPGAPVAGSNSPLCSGQTLSLTAGTIAGATYSWTGPNTYTSNIQNPSITNPTVTASGIYSVAATVNGCTGPFGTISVTVYPIPAAPLASSNSSICAGQTLSLTANNVAGATYSWNGPNGFISGVQNPTINNPTVTASGNYSVTVTVNGCTGPAGVVNVIVNAIPPAPLGSSNSTICAGNTLSLTASNIANATYSWTGPNSFTAVTQNPTVTNASTLATGVYTVSANVNGCTGPTGTVMATVGLPAFVNAGKADTICASAVLIPLSGTVTGSASNGVWSTTGTGSFGNPNNLSTTYTMTSADTSGASLTFYLTSVGGACPATTDTITFIILKAPAVNLGPDLSVCKNAVIPLNAILGGVTNTGFWTSSGTGTFNPTSFSNTGYYAPSTADTSGTFIQLNFETTNNKGCNPAKDSILVTFINAPRANFTNTIVCATQTATFTDLSAPTASVSAWNWNFGDGSGAVVAQNATHTYSAPNTYTVLLIVTSVNGCVDSVRKPVTVFATPVPQFKFENPCVGYNTLFTDSSTILNPDNIIKWNWNFADGATDTIKNPMHVYVTTGSFNVTMIVTSNNGCISVISKTVIVNPKPVANFNISANPTLANENISFTDLSTPTGSISAWSWNFGDLGGSTQQHPTHLYEDKGIYTITLGIEDLAGCVDTIRKEIFVILLPLVPTAFTPNKDGFNDLLFVKGGPFKSMFFRVYNSWGEMVFKTDNQETGWDGIYKGQPAPLGVYVWILDVEMHTGESIRKTGDITILK